MCLAAILTDDLAPLPDDTTRLDAVVRQPLLVATDANAFLRPPKDLI
jgi:hypothetical protein